MTFAEMSIKLVNDIITASNYGDDAEEESAPVVPCFPGTPGM